MIATDACLKCSLCVTACPVYQEEPLFPGPKALGPEWYRAFQAGNLEVMAHVDDCTFCQLCEAACPAEVPVAHLIAEHKTHKKKDWAQGFRDTLFSHPHWLNRLPVSKPPGIARSVLHMSSHSEYPKRYKLNKSLRSLSTPMPPLQEKQGDVYLFVDCYSRSYDQEGLAAAHFLLELWGYTVHEVPKESSCCGAAAYASGYPDAAKKIATESSERLLRAGADKGILVTLNATCDGTLRKEWPLYFELQWPGTILSFDLFAREWAPRSFWQVIGEKTGSPLYTHTTCRGKAAGEDNGIAKLVKKAGGVAQPLRIDCCGAAGSYAFKGEHEEVAHRLGERAKQDITEPGGNLLVDSGTCALHLQQITGARAMHPATWLRERYESRLKEEVYAK